MPATLAVIECLDTPDAERVRLAHRASGRLLCGSCGLRWPCSTRLRLDEVSDAAQRQYASQIHADWLAGSPTAVPRNCIPRVAAPTSGCAVAVGRP